MNKKIENALEEINAKIAYGRMLTSDLESILLAISDEYHISIIGSQGDDDTYFDIPYDSVITFTDKETEEESIYHFSREADKFIY